MREQVVFLSYINFSDPTAGAARMRMYSKMLQSMSVENFLYSIYDFYAIHACVNKLNSSRYLRFISYPARLCLYVLSLNKFIKSDCKVVFYLYPTKQVLLDYLLIIYLKFIKRQRVFLEVNEVRRYGQGVKLKSIRYFKYVLHERLAKYFDGLVCISKNIEDYYKRYNKNILRVPILSDDNAYQSNCNYKADRPFNIGFTGSIHLQKENLAIFFEALQHISNNGFTIRFNLYGRISDPKVFYRIVNYYSLAKIVVYHGVVKQDLLPEVMAKQDLLVLPRAENKQNRFGFSTKLSEYLVSGVPVLLTDVSDNLVYLTHGENCLVADFNNPESFAKQVEALIINYISIAPTLAKNAFEVTEEKFNYRIHADGYSKFLASGGEK